MTSDTTTSDDASALPSTESPAEKAMRVERERKVIAEGRSQLDAGQGIPLAALSTWLREHKAGPDALLAASSVRGEPN